MYISTSELRIQAEKINNARESLLGAGNTMISAINAMDSGLDESLEYNLCGKVSSICKKLRTLLNTINAARDTANAVADAFEGVDAELKKQVKNINTYLQKNYPGLFSEDAKRSHSEQTVVDEKQYDQTAYSQFMAYYDYDHDGKLDYINTGCVITCCAYALTLMGIQTSPLEAYDRSGGCDAYFNKISQNKAYISMDHPASQVIEMAKKSKTDANISPLMLRVNGNTHTVVLKDIEMDKNGNITKYIVFDPYKAQIKEYTSFDQIGVYNFSYYTRA